jgi:hypothetical protein
MEAAGLTPAAEGGIAEELLRRPEISYPLLAGVIGWGEGITPMLAEYCLPLVKVGGSFLAMKGASGEEELAAARGAIRKLGGEYKETRTLHLPGGDTRTLILCKKISQTPTAYPRNGGKIAKSPLK